MGKEKNVVQMLQTEQSRMVCTVSETAVVESAFLFHCSITPQTDLFCTGGISPGPLSQCSLFSCLWFCYMSYSGTPLSKPGGGGGERDGKTGKKYLKLSWGGGGGGGGAIFH